MFSLSVRTFLDRWQLFIGAILSVAMGCALVQSALQVLAATAVARVPAGLSPTAAAAVRENYQGASTLLGMTVVLAAFLAIFIVSSTFAFAVAQRRRDLALLRLIGGGRGQLRRLLLGEAVLLGVCGVAAGMPLGVPAVSVQTWLLTRLHFLPAGFVAPWAPWVSVTAAGMGVGTALLGVLAASRRAAKVRPLEALREAGTASRVMTLSRWFFGLLFLAGSLGLVVLAQTADALVSMAVALGLAMTGGIGLCLLSPLTVPLTGRLFGLLLRGPLGRLAEANLREGSRRSAAIAAPLIVLVALVLGLSSTLGSMASAAGVEQRHVVAGDLVVASTGANVDRIARVPGVALSSPQITVPTTITMRVLNADTGKPRTRAFDSGILAVDPPAYARTHRLRPAAGSFAGLRGRTLGVTDRGEDTLRLGAAATVALGGRPLPLRVATILPERIATGEDFLLPRQLVPAKLIADAPAQTVLRLRPGADAAAVARSIRAAGIGRVSTVEEWAGAQASAQQDGNVAAMVVLMSLSGLYALMAVINAVVIAGSERKREFAAVRLTGLSRAQVVRMALLEATAVTVIGLVLGGLVVAGALTGVASSTARTFGTAIVDIPWPLVGVVVLGAAAVIGTTSVLTAVSATRTRPVRLVAARE